MQESNKKISFLDGFPFDLGRSRISPLENVVGFPCSAQERMKQQRKEKANKAAQKREMFNKEMLGTKVIDPNH